MKSLVDFKTKLLAVVILFLLLEAVLLPWSSIFRALSYKKLEGERQVLIKLEGVYKLKHVEYVGLENIYIEYEDSLVVIPQDSLYQKVYIIHHSAGLEKKPLY
jgi:hypothetical protein